MKTIVKILLPLLALTFFTGTAGAQMLDEFPRTPDGKPDFSGIWQAMTSAHYDVEPHAAAYGPYPREMGALSAKPASLGIVEGGRIPYNEVSRRQRDENARDAITKDPLAKCFMPGIPRANYLPFPFQIVQSQDIILIAYEFAESNRIVYVDQPEIVSQVDAWMGHSNATWEGDTLVISVTGQMEDTWFDRAGNFHSYEMKVTERWNLVSENIIEYEATIEDPQTFSRAWTIKLPLYRRLEEGYELPQFKCVEFVEELMYGRYRKGREEELNFELNN